MSEILYDYPQIRQFLDKFKADTNQLRNNVTEITATAGKMMWTDEAAEAAFNVKIKEVHKIAEDLFGNLDKTSQVANEQLNRMESTSSKIAGMF